MFFPGRKGSTPARRKRHSKMAAKRASHDAKSHKVFGKSLWTPADSAPIGDGQLRRCCIGWQDLPQPPAGEVTKEQRFPQKAVCRGPIRPRRAALSAFERWL